MPHDSAVVWIGERDPRRRLSIADVVAVAREFKPVRIAPDAARRVELSREVVEVLVEEDVKVYGITTGFASLRNVRLTPDQAAKLSSHMIRSHSTGLGRPFPEDVVRASMLLRANTLAQGNSGVRLALLRRLVAMLNARVYPFVPEQGSLGSSGDLAPLSHVFLALMGDANARVHRRVADAGANVSARREDRFDSLGFEHATSSRRTVAPGADYVSDPVVADFVPLESSGDATVRECLREAIAAALPLDGLPATHLPSVARPHDEPAGATFDLAQKEGLAGNNGAVFTVAIAALACHDATRFLRSADLVAALSFEALQGVKDCIDERVVALRPHPGHVQSARNLRAALDGSSLVRGQAPFALNMAQFNRALLALFAARTRAVADAGAGGSKELGKKLDGLIDAMHAAQLELADCGGNRSAGHASPAGDEPAKDAEVRARRASFAKLDAAWKRLLADTDARDTVLPIHQKHGSEIVRAEGNPEVQDNYSFRAAATVAGTGWEALDRCRHTVEIELDATTDNPIVCLDALLDALELDKSSTTKEQLRHELVVKDRWPRAADAVLSAANFHGEPVGAVCDHLAAAIAEVGNIAERRVAVLTDAHHSKGLPSYLSWKPGLNSGFMMPQYTAASLVMENRHLAMPASTDSVPTGEMCEDLVAMSTYAARKCAAVIANAERIVGIEMLSAYQGVQFRRPCRLGARTAKLEAMLAERIGALMLDLGAFTGKNPSEKTADFRAQLRGLGLGEDAVRDMSPCVIDDIVLYPVLEAGAALIRRGDVSALLGVTEVSRDG